ncbi:MAG: zinc-finger domain-containing protein [Proteobacteria bacterium]|nr:zinc-finger domain-containing protein [Pseudomonadota bacterium]
MTMPAPETVHVSTLRVCCDGAGDIRGGSAYLAAALGHPRVWLEIDERGYVDCGYCDKRFVLGGSPPDSVTGKPGH